MMLEDITRSGAGAVLDDRLAALTCLIGVVHAGTLGSLGGQREMLKAAQVTFFNLNASRLF